MVVGSSGCAIGRAADADLPLTDPLVSRRHAVVRKTTSGIEIEDLGSTQGVRVNGVPLRGRMSLAHGDRNLVLQGSHDPWVGDYVTT